MTETIDKLTKTVARRRGASAHDHAVTILRALRNPSTKMVLAGRKARVHPQMVLTETADVFRAMMDEAIGDTVTEDVDHVLLKQVDAYRSLLVDLVCQPGFDKVLTEKLSKRAQKLLEEDL